MMRAIGDQVEKIQNIYQYNKGFRIYAGVEFITLKLEGHTSFLDYGKPFYETKYESYDEYYKTRSLPSQIRSYYDNYYNGGKKNR